MASVNIYSITWMSVSQVDSLYTDFSKAFNRISLNLVQAEASFVGWKLILKIVRIISQFEVLALCDLLRNLVYPKGHTWNPYCF